MLLGAFYALFSIHMTAEARSLMGGSLETETAPSPLFLKEIDPESRNSLSWSLGSAARLYESDSEKATLSVFSFNVDYQRELGDIVLTRGSVSLAGGSGYSQSLYGDFVPPEGFRVSESVLVIEPASWFYFEGGALSTSRVDHPTLLTTSAFPGISQGFRAKIRPLSVELRLTQAVPTSVTLSTKAVENEPVPEFYSEELIATFTNEQKFAGEMFVKHFRFLNLPSVVADESEIRGNTTRGPANPNTAEFRYGFDGYLTGAKASVYFSPAVELGAGGYLARNMEADEASNRGEYSWVGIGLHFSTVKILSSVSRFYNESDVSPAYYNSSTYGNNNRQGWGAHLELVFVSQNLVLNLDYVDSDRINPAISQRDQEIFTIGFKTAMDRIL